MRVDPSKTIPTGTDPAEVWVEWYKALRKWFSKSVANSYFVRFWHDRAGVGAVADTHALRSYLKDQGVELTTDFSGSLTDSAMSVMDFFSDTFTLVRNILLIVLVVGLSFLVIRWVRIPKVAGLASGGNTGTKLLT